MKFFANRAVSSKVATICVAVLLVTGTNIMPSPAQAFAVESTFIYSTIFSSIGATLRGLFGRDKAPNRRGRGFVAMEVPVSAVGTAEAQKATQCMLRVLNRRVSYYPDGWFEKRFKGKDPLKVVLKQGKLNGPHAQADITKGEITLDLEAIKASPDTDDPNFNVAIAVFHELWHIANPHLGHGGLSEAAFDYWDKTKFGQRQNIAWKKIFGTFHPMYDVAFNGKPRRRAALIGPSSQCFWKKPANAWQQGRPGR